MSDEVDRTERLRIIAMAPNSWRGMWMNRQQLLSRLAARQSIYYCTGRANVWDRHKPEWRDTPWLSSVDVDDNVLIDCAGKLLAEWSTFPLFDRATLTLTTSRWNRQLSGLSGGRSIAYVFHPEFQKYLEHMQYDRLVYHAFDRYGNALSWTNDDRLRERQLVENADLVVASSESIRESLLHICQRDIMVLPNGVDYQAFAERRHAEPADLARVSHPRIGYIGRINVKVDIPLMVALAKANPDLNFVLLGPVSNLDDETSAAYAEAKSTANITLIGPRPHGDLPGYMQHMDVGLMCYRTGRGLWSDSGYPLKMHEYLAASLPVVSADLAAVRAFSDVVRIADREADWTRLIREALDDNAEETVDARLRTAAAHSWDVLTERLESALLTMRQ